VLVLLLLLGLVGGFECNNLKRFRCKKGKTAKVNGCTWKKDKFKQYRHFPSKKKLFGICLNAGQSESEVFGTPAEQCDCGTKCRRKCMTKSGYKKKCYWASRDGSPNSLAGTCLPNRHFAGGASTFAFNDDNIRTAATQWVADEANAAATYGNISGWDISEVTKLELTFYNKQDFNGDLSKWDTSKVTNMEYTFYGAKAFNGDLSTWDTAKVTSMENTFNGAADFNGGDLSNWDISKVTTMTSMFENAALFNGNLSTWDTSKVTSLTSTFNGAAAFNADISNWNIDAVSGKTATFLGANALESSHRPSAW